MGSAGRQLDRYIRRTEAAKAHKEAADGTVFIVYATRLFGPFPRIRQSCAFTCGKAANKVYNRLASQWWRVEMVAK